MAISEARPRASREPDPFLLSMLYLSSSTVSLMRPMAVPLPPSPKLNLSSFGWHNVRHLLHLFYLSIGLPAERMPDNSQRAHQYVLSLELPQWMPCAKELEEAGVRFKKRKNAMSFLDIRFSGGILEIPTLQLYDYSQSLFRNLIAFEQTYPATPGHVTAYAMFMDCLVNTPDDMKLLHLSGILVNQMNGERDSTRFFDRICTQVHYPADLNYLAGVIEEVNKYQGSAWPRWRTALVRNYYTNPWVTTSLLAAVLLLTMTVLQTFLAAYGYFKPPKQLQY